METNKLLTLEEIEGMEASVDSFDAKTKAFFARKGVTLNALLATARAYWEMKNQYDIITSEFDSSGRFINKPHPATLKVIVEAIKVGANANSEFNAIWAIIKSLEKHLE